MNNSDNLTVSGLLYEGSDFDTWLESLQKILTQHDPHFGIISRERSVFGEGADFDDVSAIMWWQVSHYVRSRVSSDNRKNPNVLLNALATVARPFRFLDLPAEIRLRVYHLVLIPSCSRMTVALTSRVARPSGPFQYTNGNVNDPPLALANRQLRAEALPVFFGTTRLELMFDRRMMNAHNLDRAHMVQRQSERYPDRQRITNAQRVYAINRWAEKISTDRRKLMRKLSVQLSLLKCCSVTGREDMLRFSLDLVDGKLVLSVEEHAWLTYCSQLLLSGHTAAISKLAQSLKSEGEALIMVLTSRPDIWDQLALAYW